MNALDGKKDSVFNKHLEKHRYFEDIFKRKEKFHAQSNSLFEKSKIYGKVLNEINNKSYKKEKY